MRAARTLLIAAALLAAGLPSACRQAPQTKLEKLEVQERQLQTKLDKLREKQRQLEARIPELEDRLAQTRSALERERKRFEEGTPTRRAKHATPTPV